MKLLSSLIIIIIFICSSAFSFPIPKKNTATFDIIRKNKIIGSAETIFTKKNNILIVNTIIDIKLKVLFIPAYKFSQNSKEIWKNNEFIEFYGHTDFEDEREYFVEGVDLGNKFIAKGMDGKLVLNSDILPLNYWNKKILLEDELFDTQKGIVRKITVKRLPDEIITLNKQNISTEKYIFDASSNPKDKGPFPQYTLWYDDNDELVKFQFKNWKDKKIITTQRNNWSQ